MRIQIKPWLSLTLLAVIIALVIFSVHYRRHRFIRSDAEMAALLPSRPLEATSFFIDVAALRQAQVLNLLAASKPAEEPDYRQFVAETGFDYTKDVDALAGSADGKQVLLVLRGRFNWAKLRLYAAGHGGLCGQDFCKVPTSGPGRWASFLPIQSDYIGLALSEDGAAVLALAPRRIEHAEAIPTQPVWVKVAHNLLSDPRRLPAPMQIFAILLQSADAVTLSLGPSPAQTQPFELRLEARCQNPAIADTARTQLENQTKVLKLELEREHRQPNAADLTGLLTAGGFQVMDKTVIGRWPIKRELLKALQ